MNWQHFQTYNDAPTHAFESMCDQLFELWCKTTYDKNLLSVDVVNGSGGDGGVEAFAELIDGTVIGMQAKWFTEKLSSSQFDQIRESVETAIMIRPNISMYIVCVPRDLAPPRMGKSGVPVKQSELNRWKILKQNIESRYPSINIELWNETKILSLLQEGNAAGIQRYWFEKSEISFDTLTFSFEKQKAGWLSQKYIPALHSVGILQNDIQEFLGTTAIRRELLAELNGIESLCNNFVMECKAYQDYYKEDSKNDEHLTAINNALMSTSELIGEIHAAGRIIAEEYWSTGILNVNKWKLTHYELISLIKEKLHSVKNHAHLNSLKKAANLLDEYDVSNLYKKICKQFGHSLLVILGEPGTGKTHGIANQIEKLMNEQNHLSILIRAKDYEPNANWHEMIIRALGLSKQWNELEVWNALEALSYRTEVNIAHKEIRDIKVKSKILIFIDGIDESMPYGTWLDRLREISAITNRHKRVKFCVTSRPYVFRELSYNDSLLKNVCRLPLDGDVPVSRLFHDYIQYYQIDVKNSPWIRECLKTPYALRLFCENYQGTIVGIFEKSSVTITHLIQYKINRIEIEFREKFHSPFGNREPVVQTVLLTMANKFLSGNEFSREELISELSMRHGLLQGIDRYALNLLDYFEDYGLLQSRKYNTKNLLEPAVVKYSIGTQPLFDYLIALQAINLADKPENLRITSGLKRHKGALQMACIILLEDYSLLISDSDNAQKTLGHDLLLELTCFALANVSVNAAGRYTRLVYDIMSRNAECLRIIVNHVIIPVARTDGHPLGPTLLHKYLASFESAAQRDIRWSVPDYLETNALWSTTQEIVLLEYDHYKLQKEDSHSGLPLIYAWMLTTVNNYARSSCRQELMRWALVQPEEFCKLFENVTITNDPQMREDLFAIAMGISFSGVNTSPYMKWLKDWMLNNIFSGSTISENYSSAIRYYCHSIMERLFSIGVLSHEDVSRCRPPYATQGYLPIAKEALSGTRMGGFGPIEYDLARYVLCDYIDDMFFSSYTNSHDSDNEIDYTVYFSENEIKKLLNNENSVLSENSKASLEKALDSHNEKNKFWEQLNIRITYEDDEKSENEEASVVVNMPEQTQYSEADRLMQEYASILGVDSLLYEQFIIALAYAYILKMGWNKNDFYGEPNGGEPGEVIGVDIAIMRDHNPATHGEKSSVMTFAEKYVWCARNVILGYFADRLPFINEEEVSLLRDYSLLDDFTNPAQEICQQDENEIAKTANWFLPEELSPLPRDTKVDDYLRKWIADESVPNFQRWILPDNSFNPMIQNGCTALYGYTSVSNSLYGETLMWISSGIINKSEFRHLLRDINNKQEYLIRELDNPADFHSSTQARYRLTPKEACWMNWKSEYGNQVDNISIDGGEFVYYSFNKAVEECVAHYVGQDDVYYMLPSRSIREYLSICDGDGYSYHNKEKDIVATWSHVGEKWYDYQSYLFVDRLKLETVLEREGMQLFWLIRLMRKATPKGKEAYPNALEQYDRCWLAWCDHGVLNTIQYFDSIR